MQVERFFIGKVEISLVNMKTTLLVVNEMIREQRYGYICVANSRTTYLANHNSEYCRIQNNSILTVPDGFPLVWFAHNKGFKDVDKVSGKDLMDAIFAISEDKGYSHYFFGSTPTTIKRLHINLQEKYPGLDIKGVVSPPFQEIEKFDVDSLAAQINQLKPTFFWCGLGAPKQEQLISLLQPKLVATIAVGVGLAFEYIAGTVTRAPKFMEKLGMEWFYRCLQQPVKAQRFVKPFFWMLYQMIAHKKNS